MLGLGNPAGAFFMEDTMSEDLKDSTKKIGDAIAREAEDVGDAFK
jgi:hypothetical protein